MKPVAWRLAVTAVLFVAWIGYLAFLALTVRNPVVLSRPQLLVSDVDAVAHLQDDNFVVDEVLWPTDRTEELKGKKIVVTNLKDCQTWSADRWRFAPPAEGQPVLLPLRAAPGKAAAEGGDRFEVVPIPASPGYPSDSRRTGPPRIYPADAAVLSQYRSIRKP